MMIAVFILGNIEWTQEPINRLPPTDFTHFAYICVHSITIQWHHRLKISNPTWQVKKAKHRKQEQVGLSD